MDGEFLYVVMRYVKFDDEEYFVQLKDTNFSYKVNFLAPFDGCTGFIPIFDNLEAAQAATEDGKYEINLVRDKQNT